MPTVQIPGQTGTYEISASSTGYQLADGEKLRSGDDFLALHELSGSTSNFIQLDGIVRGNIHAGIAVRIDGTSTLLTVGDTGVVGAVIGIYMAGASGSLVNHGLIRGSSAAVVLSSGTTFTNTGELRLASVAIDAAGGNALSFDSHSIVDGYTVAINLRNEDGTRIDNDGLITSRHYAIRGREGDIELINTGRILGAVELSNGDDLFDTRKGSFEDQVLGKNGSDTYVVNNDGIVIREKHDDPDSVDTVKTTVSYVLDRQYDIERLVLLGHRDIDGTGDDTANEITGNIGDNRLAGRGGHDLFVFNADFGHDRIADFKPGQEKIDLSAATDIDSFHDLKSHMRDVAGGVLVDLGADTILLELVPKADLHGADFLFG